MMVRLLFVSALALFAQNEASSLSGVVVNPQHQPIAAATVRLTTGAGKVLTTVTGADGTYRFAALPAGRYTLQSADTTTGPFALAPGESRKIDLTITPNPQFFDEPSFIVAGVTDPSLRGGHGSDADYRSAESLTKQAASLRNDPSHKSRADEDEARGDALDAVREYQRAAELDPSEANLFDWGVELLKHRAGEQSAEVFSRAHRLYPHSTRVLLGLAVALFSRGAYDDAAQRFFEAADINPTAPTPYLFLGRLPPGQITQTRGYAERLERFATLHPASAEANYYYAAALWNRDHDPARVLPLLEKAVSLDPHLGRAWLLLGVVHAEQNRLPQAIAAFQSAIAADPSTSAAHYRLAQAWQKTGETDQARAEMAVYRELSEREARQSELERSGIQEFVFSLRR